MDPIHPECSFMPRRKKTPRSARRSRRKQSQRPIRPSVGEWVGGRLLTPFYIAEGPEPYRPEIVLWMGWRATARCCGWMSAGTRFDFAGLRCELGLDG